MTLFRAGRHNGWAEEVIRLANYLPADSCATRVTPVSGRGLFSPPPVTTSFPSMIAADGASTFSANSPTTFHLFDSGSYSRISPTTFRGGFELLHRPPTTRIRPLWIIVLDSK